MEVKVEVDTTCGDNGKMNMIAVEVRYLYIICMYAYVEVSYYSLRTYERTYLSSRHRESRV